MARIREELAGGLVTVKDPALLKPGQLSASKNAVLKFGTDALHRSPGRSAFGTVTASAIGVVGLRDIKFDNGLQIIAAHASASYLTATAGDASTFGLLASGVGAGSQLEVVHYRNRFFLFNGTSVSDQAAAGSNRVIYLSATATGTAPTLRSHGLLPVSITPTTATATGVFSQSVTGYYEYWTTEMAEVTQDGAKLQIESGFQADPATVYVTATGQVPVISRPEIQNPLSTHWRIYRSPKKETDKAIDRKFPIGFLVGTLGATATADASFSDTQTVSSSTFVFPASYNGVSPDTSIFYTNWTNASALGADDTGYASATNVSITTKKQQAVFNFPFSGIQGSIKGIEVTLEAFVSSGAASVPISVTIGPARQASGLYSGVISNGVQAVQGRTAYGASTASKSVTITASSAGTTYTLGSSADRWYPPEHPGLSASDFDSNFMVVISISQPSVTVVVDYVKVRVHYAAAQDGTTPFPTVVYTFGDITAQVMKNGPPPSSSTGDVYEDTLVVNDVSNPGLIRYSYPGDPEAFPPTYYIDFETRENDRVTLIKAVNNKLVVGLDTSIWRANYLPSERDASFDRGKAIEPISQSFGVVNPMCACVYSPTGGPQLLAFVSQKGIFSTNGYSLEELTGDLDWRGVLPTTVTSDPIALIDDPENRCLRFQYRNDANGNETYLELRINYDGRVSGPSHLRNYHAGSTSYGSLESAWSVRRSTGATQVLYGYGGATAAGGGQVYVEGGTTIPSNDSTMGYVTRRMYLADFGNEWSFDELYGYAGSYSGTPGLSFTIEKTKTNDAGPVAGGTKAITLGGQRFFKAGDFHETSEGVRVSASVTATTYQQEFLLIGGTNFQEEDSGRS